MDVFSRLELSTGARLLYPRARSTSEGFTNEGVSEPYLHVRFDLVLHSFEGIGNLTSMFSPFIIGVLSVSFVILRVLSSLRVD